MSKEIFEKNLKAMEKWYPEFADDIRKRGYAEKKDSELMVECERSWDDEVIFRVSRKGRALYLNGKRNAKAAAEIWMERMGTIQDYAPVLLLGGGSGIYLKYLLQNTTGKVNIMVYEPSLEIFLEMLGQVDLSEQMKAHLVIFVVEGINESALNMVIARMVSMENVEFLKTEIHPNYQQLFPEQILETMRFIERQVAGILSGGNTRVTFQSSFTVNQMQNMKYVCEGYNTFGLHQAVPHDGPAVLVSAGPSLNKNVEELKAAKNKAFILAVDTAVKPLLRAGVVPDAYITIDPKKPTKLLDVDCARDIPVVAPATANYEILKEQRGKKIFYFDGYVLPYLTYAAAGKKLWYVDVGGSVACSGFSLLYLMGFSTIILVGQDLAYSDNKSHADYTFQEKMPEKDTRKMFRVKGNYADKVPTTGNLKRYLDWLNGFIKNAKKVNELRVINATEGGAYIENTELMTLKEALEETCGEEIDFESCIADMKSEFQEEERKMAVEYLHMVPDKLNEIAKNAKSLQNMYRKLEKLCRSGNLDKNAYLKLLKRIKKQTKKCEESDIYQLVSATMARAELVVRGQSLLRQDSFQEEGLEIANQGKTFSEMMEECAKLLSDYAKETLLDIE